MEAFDERVGLDIHVVASMCVMTRTFYPVGQGAFYSEEFKDPNGVVVFRAVYDCGSLRWCKLQPKRDGSKLSRAEIERRVENAFTDDDVIDILFISHLDDDHVNLISHLKPFNMRNHIRRVVLPLLDTNERFMLTGYYLLSNWLRNNKERSDALKCFIIDPENYFESCEKIVFVQPYGSDGVSANEKETSVSIDDLPDSIVSFTEITTGKKVSRGGELALDNWVFVPYNHQPERFAELKKLLDDAFRTMKPKFSVAMLKDVGFVTKNLKVLRRCYKKLKDGINRNSMALYSGPVDRTDAWSATDVEGSDGRWIGCYLRQMPERCLECGATLELPFISGAPTTFLNRPGCLYTGDISLNDAQLTMHYGRYDKCIGTVQLPHHGSQDSFGDGDLPIAGRVCVATYGECNIFGHPALRVKRDIAEKDGFWVDVTELEESQFKVEYKIG